MATLDQIFRHPVKSLGEEPLDRVTLSPGAALPWDRVWAVAHGRSEFDPDRPEWVKSRNFVTQTSTPELARIGCAFDAESGRLTLTHPELGEITLNPEAEAARLTDWLSPIAAPAGPPPWRLARLPGAALTDFPDSHVSIGSRASLRALEQMAGLTLAPIRFRMNLWVEGLAPWEEFDWTGGEIRIGGALLKVTGRVKRCTATGADPATGRRNADLPRLLYDRFGHMDFGVYAEVVEGGEIAVGDAVTA